MVEKSFFKAAAARMDRLKGEYPGVWKRLSRTLEELEEREGQALQILYAGLDCHDLLSADPGVMLSYVRASARARRLLPYTRQIPRELFYGYVLPPRVNNEWPDGSRGWLLDNLYPRVKDLDLMAAALEVNLWCFEKATYQPTDDRTAGPLGICHRGFGRCGEESTLLVCALRAVGIPARQCYVPYWAHCDDNHAWVEFWAGDGWHHIGACEPEPEADRGWFLSAASRAMLVRSRVPDPGREEGWRMVNTIGRYAKTCLLRIRVTDRGRPVPGAGVRFGLINYSRIQTLCSCTTDAQGIASLETGLGTLLVSTTLEGIYVEKILTLEGDTLAELSREEGMDPLREEARFRCLLSPPRERIPEPAGVSEEYRQKLRRSEALREAYGRCFAPEGSSWLGKARGNREEIRKFLSLEGYAPEDKEALLETLEEKDFCDCTCRVLESFLGSALTWKDRYPRDLWQRQILAPRVEHEMLLPIRPELERLLAEVSLSDPREVLTWMEGNLRKVPEYGLTDRRGDAAGYLRSRCCPESEWDILAVQICRALGIPASLSPMTKKLQLPESAAVKLVLKVPEGPMREEETFSLSRWDGEDYAPVSLGGRVLREDTALSLAPGAYCLAVTRRQIDGSVNASVHRFLLGEDRELTLRPQPDQTAEKLISVPLPRLSMAALTRNAEEVARSAGKRPSLLIFLEPGKEPTEHLLREILDLEDAVSAGEIPIRFLVREGAALKDPTLSRVLKRLEKSAAWQYPEGERFAVQAAAGTGDARLPLALALDSRSRILYGCANYNIRTAATLLHILSLAQ